MTRQQSLLVSGLARLATAGGLMFVPTAYPLVLLALLGLVVWNCWSGGEQVAEACFGDEGLILDIARRLGDAGEKAAIPDSDKATKRRQQIEDDLKRVTEGRERLMRHIVNDTLTEAEAKKKLDELKDRREQLLADLDKVNTIL